MGRTAENVVLHQILMYGIPRQTRAPMLVASVGAAQCYERIAHSIAGHTLQASGVPASSIRSMLKPMQEMIFLSGQHLANQKIMWEARTILRRAVDRTIERRHQYGSR